MGYQQMSCHDFFHMVRAQVSSTSRQQSHYRDSREVKVMVRNSGHVQQLNHNNHVPLDLIHHMRLHLRPELNRRSIQKVRHKLGVQPLPILSDSLRQERFSGRLVLVT